MSFEVNGHVYPRFYLLIDGIYPQWSCFLQPIHEAQGEKLQHYTKVQEGARNDVERAFWSFASSLGDCKKSSEANGP
jgi:hypothetical protein